MATFHIPGLTAEQAEERYRELASGYQVPVPPTHQRIRRITFRNNETGNIITAEVGKSFAPTWSTVMAILPGPPTVVVCAEQHKHSFVRATRATTDEQLLKSWIESLGSPHSQANFKVTAERFLAELGVGLREATVEDVRDALNTLNAGKAETTARQYVLRIKSLLTYAHSLGYTPFNAGARIKVRGEGAQRGASIAKRIVSEVEVRTLIRGARTKRDQVLLETLYAGGLRVSEVVALTWADVIPRDDKVQLSVTGKGGFTRQVLLPAIVSKSLLSLRGDAGGEAPVFPSRTGGHLGRRAVLGLLKRAAAKADVNGDVSPHWLRHATASHSIARGASLPEVQATLGHGNVSTTSGYLHARPDTSCGLKLDEGVFIRHAD